MTNPRFKSFELLLLISQEVEEKAKDQDDDVFAAKTRSRYIERILGMMKDYEIDMVEAMLWDFESFGYNAVQTYKKRGLNAVEVQFEEYLRGINLIMKDGDIRFFRDMFTGKTENLVLRKDQ
jgi:hypothetical protein